MRKSNVVILSNLMAIVFFTSTYAASFTYTLTYDTVNRITRVMTGGTNQTDYTWQENGKLLSRTLAGDKLAGDLDGNGTIDLTDTIIAMRIITSISTPIINPASDVNKDGKLGLSETIYILQKVAE